MSNTGRQAALELLQAIDTARAKARVIQLLMTEEHLDGMPDLQIHNGIKDLDTARFNLVNALCLMGFLGQKDCYPRP